jgi:hypothetical protein
VELKDLLRQAAKDAGDTQLASQKLALLAELLAQVLDRKIRLGST